MRHVVFLANLLFSFSLAITAYINSSYIASGVGTRAVGMVYMASAILTIYVLSRACPTLGKVGNRRYFLLYAGIHALSLFILALPVGAYGHALALMTYIVSASALYFSFDIFFEHTTETRGRGKSRGLYLALSNCGWVIAPLCTATILDRYGYGGIYAIALFVFLFLVYILQTGLRKYQDPKYTPHKTRMLLGEVWKAPTLRTVVLANFILQIFYAWMVVYVPIYLSQNLGLSWDIIGFIFAIMLTSFVILDYPLGRLADWIGSEKELAAIGFIIMAMSLFGFALIPHPTIAAVGVLMLLSRIGAATVETMTEIHFFKIVSIENPMYVSLFRDLNPLANVITPVIALTAFSLLTFRHSFAAFGCILIIGFVATFFMEQKRAWWVREHTL